jgi:DNA-binding response OmpR family regulator
MSSRKVCLIDDEISILDAVGVFFEQHGFNVQKFNSSQEFINRHKDLIDVDAYIVDYLMPGETDGISLVKMIRGNNDLVPIFMLTASDTKKQVIAGIEAGADDYITKPCDLNELMARIRNAIKKYSVQDERDAKLRILSEGKLVMYNGSSVSLTSREFSIFKELYQNLGSAVDRNKLLSTIEPDSSEMIKRNVDVHVFSLRRKLASINLQVITVRGIGYQLKL